MAGLRAVVTRDALVRGFGTHHFPADDGPPLEGRTSELAALRRGLDGEPRLLNIHGLAGSGKTRLAQELIGTTTDRFAEGFVVADLVGCATEDAALAVICTALDLSPRSLDDLVQTLADARLLVVLDNVDLVADTAVAVAAALGAGNGIRVLACSVLPVPGGHVTRVPLGGLPTPAPRATAEGRAASPSVRLFARAATEVDAGFVLDEATSEAVADICRIVGGWPVALELAAARTTLGVSTLANLLSDVPMLDLLSDRRGPTGQVNPGVRGALAATYDLLDESTERILRRLAIFLDPFGLDAAVAVADSGGGGGGGGGGASAFYDDLSLLVDLRLVDPVAGRPDGPHFRMSPVVRAFAMERLQDAGEELDCQDAHARHFAELAREANVDLDDAREYEALGTFRHCAADLSAACDHLVERGDDDRSMRMAADLGVLSPQHTGRADVLRRLEAVLDSPDFGAAPASTRADVLLWAGILGFRSHHALDVLELAYRRWAAGLELAKAVGEPGRLLRAWRGFIVALPVHGRFAECEPILAEARRVAADAGHVAWLARCEAWTAMYHHQLRAFVHAAAFAQSALGRALRCGDRTALILTGMVLHRLPDEHRPADSPVPSLERLLEMAVDLEDIHLQSMLLANLAAAAVDEGEVDAAAHWTGRRLDLVSRSGEWHGAGFSLIALVDAAVQRGDPSTAARWHGSLSPMLDVVLAGIAPRDQDVYRASVDRARQELGVRAFTEAMHAGSLLSWQDAAIEGLAHVRELLEVRASPGATAVTQGGEILTPRELQVLGLLAQGLSNKAIAARLGVTAKTVMHHSVAIYQKLGVRGRAQAAVTAIRTGLVEG